MSAVKTLRVCDYDAYGFDIDHTIAKYNIPHLFDVSYRALAEYLVDEKGYDPYLLEPFDKDFCTRGLILDLQRGNVVKLSHGGTVLRASHGTRFMTDEEIEADYGAERHWEIFDDVVNTVNNVEGKCRIFENFFDMPGNLLCARLVDMADKKAHGRPEKYTFWTDVSDAYNDAYHPRQFEANKGGYFPQFKTETAKFLQPCSRDVKQWLKKLRESNKKVFIMTSSFVDFASCTMEFVLGKDWRDYFDYFLFLARKPSFFTDSRYFLRLEGISEKEPVMDLKEGEFYSQGNVKQFQETLAASLNTENPRVLFFGDSLRSDIFPAKRYADWDTVQILEEMEAEVKQSCPELVVDEKGDIQGPPPKRQRLSGPSQLEKEYLTSEQWGSFFTDCAPESRAKQMDTLWGYIIRKYSDVAVPHLDAIADCPLGRRLPVFDHKEPRVWGFHPSLPVALRDGTLEGEGGGEGPCTVPGVGTSVGGSGDQTSPGPSSDGSEIQQESPRPSSSLSFEPLNKSVHAAGTKEVESSRETCEAVEGVESFNNTQKSPQIVQAQTPSTPENPQTPNERDT